MHTRTIAQQVNLAASRAAIPLSVFAEVTTACNHRCYHCLQQSHTAGDELPLGRWKSLLGELAAEGSLYIAFSGGAPVSQ